MAPPRLHLHLLGLFRLLQGHQPLTGLEQARLQHLLAYLVLHRATPVSRQQLAFLFWPESLDQQALKNLRTLLTRLRRALPDADRFIAVTPQAIQWLPDAPLTLDVAEFEAALARAAAGQARGDTAATTSACADAVAAYGGELLPDCYDDWAVPLRTQLQQAYGNALEQLVLLLEEQRAYERAIPYAQRLVEHDSLHEPAYRHLMRLHLALGERADALRVYQACDAMLQREFGLGPGRTTRTLYERLICGEERTVRSIPGQPPEAWPVDLPLVGRKAEWERLVAAWRNAAAGRPHMLLLTGEAGIGKTRLAEELYAWVARQGAATVSARCYAGSTALPYAPVTEWLSDALLRPRLAALDDAWWVEVARIVPALLAARPHLAPAGPLTEAWQRTRLFEALARALLGPAASRGDVAAARVSRREPQPPLFLFLDDLQWVDLETLDWLGYLLRFDPAVALLIVSTVRLDEVDPSHPLAAFRLEAARSGLLSEIALAPLDAVETAALAASAAGQDMAAEADRIFRDSEGNPLFVVEMVRAGLREGEAGRYREEGAELARSSALPVRVRAMIQWRLAMLSPVAQAVAQVAAVIGRKFSFAVLAHAGDGPEPTVAQGLDELWQHRLVRVQGDDAYDFSHDGIRAVAYAEIGPIRRRELHHRVAQALETLYAADLDALSSQIAVHYEQAGQMQAAARFYRRAAAVAQRVYANAEATRLYSRLLEGDLRTSLTPQERCEITLALAEVWRVTGQWVRAQAIIREALAAAETLGDIRLQAQAQRNLADVLQLLGYYDTALEWLARAESGFRAVGEWRGVVSVLWTMGQSYWFLGDHPQALAALERQLHIATEINDERGICEALETMGMVYWSEGDWPRAADCCLKAMPIATRLDYKHIITRASITLGNVRSSEYWFGEAVHWYLRAGMLARESGDRQIVSWATSNIARVLAKRGDYRAASTGHERSLRNAWEIGDRWTACLNVAGLAAVNERLGRLDLAETLYRRAIGFGRLLGIPSYLAGMLVGLARLLLAGDRATEARALYDEAATMISAVAGERLAGEDTRFDARVLGVRLRHALGESSPAEAIREFAALLRAETAPRRQAALQYEMWRLAPEDAAAQAAAATYYQAEYAETGADDCRERYHELTGEGLLDPPPLPDVSELIPDEPDRLDLARLLAALESSFGQGLVSE